MYCLSVISLRMRLRTQYFVSDVLIYPCFPKATYSQTRNMSQMLHKDGEYEFSNKGIMEYRVNIVNLVEA